VFLQNWYCSKNKQTYAVKHLSAYVCLFLEHFFSPRHSAIVSTSNRMHGEILRLLFLQAHRETEAHFTAAGMPSQRNQSESFWFKRAAFYQGLKSKVGLAAANAAALRINLNVQGCSIIADPMHAPSALPFSSPSFFHTISLPRVH
jgi:hypothetical protein